MTILETDKEVLRKRGYDGNCSRLSCDVFISRVAVDRIEQAHEAAKLEDKKKEEGMG
jgi:hypothetical protein